MKSNIWKRYSRFLISLWLCTLIVGLTFSFQFRPMEEVFISDLTGTDGRNVRSVPPISILPSSVAIANDFHDLEFLDKDTVMFAQLILKADDLYSGSVSGKLDFETQISLVNFQRRVGLNITGNLDEGTLRKMESYD